MKFPIDHNYGGYKLHTILQIKRRVTKTTQNQKQSRHTSTQLKCLTTTTDSTTTTVVLKYCDVNTLETIIGVNLILAVVKD